MSISALVIDDEPIARHAIVRLLRDDPDIELLGECGDGASAVVAIRSQRPDLVFLDIQMPDLSGWEVAREIRRRCGNGRRRLREVGHDRLDRGAAEQGSAAPRSTTISAALT